MTPEQAKLLCKVFADTMQNETKTTAKVIRAIPEDKKSYQPEPKARTAHDLAWHLVTAEIWFLDGVLNGEFSMGETPGAPPTIGAILEWYESNYRDRIEKLNNLAADKLSKPLPFFGIMEMPAVSYLNFLNLHTAHHRGQLSTYLRPMGSKVPDIYGGSADEPFQAPAQA
jgi:uncharacterized damage-inducible protein DinB